jgi:hypothetical protein
MAEHLDTCVVQFYTLKWFDSTEAYGGIRIEITLDDYPPDSSLVLELLCPDFHPDCCPPWVPVDFCTTIGDLIPLQWTVPEVDVLGLREKVWFFIVSRDTLPDVDLYDQLDSIAVDWDLSVPRFQWVDTDFGLDRTYYYRVYAVDEAGNISFGSNEVMISTVSASHLGDVTGDGVIDLGDAVFLLYYIFRIGPAPEPLWLGDCNCDYIVDVADAVCLIVHICLGGPPPDCF